MAPFRMEPLQFHNRQQISRSTHTVYCYYTLDGLKLVQAGEMHQFFLQQCPSDTRLKKRDKGLK